LNVDGAPFQAKRASPLIHPQASQEAPQGLHTAMPFALSPERERKLQEILERYPTKMAATLPLLHLCQEQEGFVGDDVVDFVARRLDLSPAHVKGVVTFYTLYNQEPVGKHQVWVCRTLPCALRGAYDVIAHCEKRLGIHCGETTGDGKVTLRSAECLASCGTAPMMQVDRDYHENLTKERVDQILNQLLES
jgi:NADH-quinone oxidoreductase subunit E